MLSTTVSEPILTIQKHHPSFQYPHAFHDLQWGDFEFMLRGTFSDLGCPFTHIFDEKITTNLTTLAARYNKNAELPI